MRRSLLPFSLLAAVAIVVSACSDSQPTGPEKVAAPVTVLPAPNRPLARLTSPTATLPDECATEARAQSAIDSLLPQLFKPGAGKRGKAQVLSNVIVKARRDGDQPAAETGVEQLINFTLQSYFANDLIAGQSAATQERVLKFIYLLYCSNGISPVPDLSGIFSAPYTVLIRPNTPDTVVVDNPTNTQAAIKVRLSDVPDALFGTFVSVVPVAVADTLPTNLDWYGLTGYKSGAFEFVANPAVTFDQAARAGVCIQYDNAIVTSPSDLWLAHGVASGATASAPGNYVVGNIEILAPVDVSGLGLDCVGPLSFVTQTPFGRALRRATDFLLPQELAAIVTGGSRGGDIKSLSPFAVVDTKLNVTGSGPTSPQYIPVGSTTTTAPATVTVKTRNSATGISGIPVTFAATSPTGSSFSPPPPPTTAANGTATSTWTLVAGMNIGTGTPVLLPFTFDGSPVNFNVQATQLVPVVVATAPAPPAGTVGVAYPAFSFSATGGIGAPYTFAKVSGALPPGLSLSAAGALSGTPTASGNFTFDMQATSGSGASLVTSATQSFTIMVSPPPVDITTTSLPNAQLGLAYSQQLAATGGNNTYAWTLATGSLPASLGLSGTGVISGVPSVLGTANFSVTASSNGGSDAQALSLTVVPPSALTLAFSTQPADARCNALILNGSQPVAVRVTDQANRALTGVRVNLVAVTNNGTNVVVSQPFAVSATDGRAVFNTLSINKTGGYSLIGSTTTPWPTASAKSVKFNISPAC